MKCMRVRSHKQEPQLNRGAPVVSFGKLYICLYLLLRPRHYICITVVKNTRLLSTMFVSDIAIFVLKRDVKLQLTN